MSYELNIGPIPEGMFVLHSCDNPPCIEPQHLFLGDALTNARDRDIKGRCRPHGSKERGETAYKRAMAGAATRKYAGGLKVEILW